MLADHHNGRGLLVQPHERTPMDQHASYALQPGMDNIEREAIRDEGYDP